ncbi:potassium-transporting ATPase subunit KdpC [Lichenihabitans psoromatis]|uniref:potassium-transporting ATPase subunit KdpC n=1 Tax=Lichenihabitans psoromatis TaxID=2528642 RepID=UPI001035E2CD|nr:potassium-transporting ATPase subunit KdpC [Lichenihabitans psoromatis]
MLNHIRPAIVMIVLFTALTGVAYPLAITGIAQVAMRGHADGSLVVRDGKTVGSSLIGQNFTSDQYFHGRPSATSGTDPADATKTVDQPYNASNSSASNFGPTSQKLVDRVKASVAALNGSPQAPVPADAVTTSASGLDPHISPAYATLQVDRVARARKMSVDRIQALVEQGTSSPVLGFMGQPRVNVLNLNLAIDALSKTPGPAATVAP